MKIGSIILGIIFAIFLICIFIEIKKLKELFDKKQELLKSNQIYENDCNKLKNDKLNLENSLNLIALEKDKIQISKEEMEKSIESLIKTQKEMGVTTEELKESLRKGLEDYKNHLKEKKEKNIEEYNQEYLSIIEDYSKEYQLQTEQKKEKIKNLEIKLENMKNVVSAAVEASKRDLQEKEQEQFYKLQIPDEDMKEIKKLKEVGMMLRNPEPLNKVIWKVYYEKPTTDLIGRVVGEGRKTGIYKITNLENNMCYVGQAVSISDRWKQHIKRGIGAETPTRNKLYPAMAKFGVENFSFEIIELCEQNQLNEKEDYWQDYFKAITFGYSIK